MKQIDYICTLPFTYTQVFKSWIEGCCWDWCKATQPLNGESLGKAWQEFRPFRESSLNGTLEFCNMNCPFLSKLVKTGNTSGIFVPRTKENISYYTSLLDIPGPREIRISCDDSCNLYCKSCRLGRIQDNSVNVQSVLNLIENEWGKTLEKITVLGSGDPFFSIPVRNWLLNFDKSRYPKLQDFAIHTNGQLLTESFWKKMKAAPFVKTLEISIDAATKETYEQIRRGGKWERLMNNIEFITNQSSIRFMTFSFVVQKDNYKEIEEFYKTFKPLVSRTGRGWEIAYNQVQHWGRLSDEDFDAINPFTDEEVAKEIKDRVKRLTSTDLSHVRTNIF